MVVFFGTINVMRQFVVVANVVLNVHTVDCVCLVQKSIM